MSVKTNVVHGVKMSINFPQITAKQLQIFDQEAKLLNSFLKKVAEKWFVVVWTSNSLIKGQAQWPRNEPDSLIKTFRQSCTPWGLFHQTVIFVIYVEIYSTIWMNIQMRN